MNGEPVFALGPTDANFEPEGPELLPYWSEESLGTCTHHVASKLFL